MFQIRFAPGAPLHCFVIGIILSAAFNKPELVRNFIVFYRQRQLLYNNALQHALQKLNAQTI
ncbi:MAG: hypothetical protein U5L07_09435 [Desulfobacterales bacterium]|nr:hypothetical protein [Desulfobacterales bacterium]